MKRSTNRLAACFVLFCCAPLLIVSMLAPKPPPRDTPLITVPTIRAGSAATPALVLPATATPTAAPTFTAEQVKEQVDIILSQLDAYWDADWPHVIDLLKQARMLDPANNLVSEKLYAAHYNYGRALLSNSKTADAIQQFKNCLDLKPDGAEARAALLSLTPTATATRTLIPTATPRSTSVYKYRIGATCADGTYSSATGQGACSWHGGVREWIYNY